MIRHVLNLSFQLLRATLSTQRETAYFRLVRRGSTRPRQLFAAQRYCPIVLLKAISTAIFGKDSLTKESLQLCKALQGYK